MKKITNTNPEQFIKAFAEVLAERMSEMFRDYSERLYNDMKIA